MDQEQKQTLKDVSEEIGIDLEEVRGQMSEATLNEAMTEGSSTFIVTVPADEAGEEDEDAEDSDIEIEITMTARVLD